MNSSKQQPPPGVFRFKDFFIVNWMMTEESHFFNVTFYINMDIIKNNKIQIFSFAKITF